MQTLVTSHLACMTHAYVHGAYALCRNSASKCLSGLAYTQPNSNLEKITATEYPKCKLELANHDSHCISQQELHGLQ